MVSRVCIRNMAKLGLTIGKVYSINTLGAISGSFVAGFVLIPVTGVKNGIILVALINPKGL